VSVRTRLAVDCHTVTNGLPQSGAHARSHFMTRPL
jgi:hypothetical protein